MADLGEPLRVIEITPIEAPVPDDPDPSWTTPPDAVPNEEPDRVEAP